MRGNVTLKLDGEQRAWSSISFAILIHLGSQRKASEDFSHSIVIKTRFSPPHVQAMFIMCQTYSVLISETLVVLMEKTHQSLTRSGFFHTLIHYPSSFLLSLLYLCLLLPLIRFPSLLSQHFCHPH